MLAVFLNHRLLFMRMELALHLFHALGKVPMKQPDKLKANSVGVYILAPLCNFVT